MNLRFGIISCQVKKKIKLHFVNGRRARIKNKTKVQNIIFIASVMRTINPYTHSHGRLITSFQTKDPIHSSYLSVKILKIKTLYQFFYRQKKNKNNFKKGVKEHFYFFSIFSQFQLVDP